MVGHYLATVDVQRGEEMASECSLKFWHWVGHASTASVSEGNGREGGNPKKRDNRGKGEDGETSGYELQAQV